MALIAPIASAQIPRSIEENEGRILLQVWALDDQILHPESAVDERLLEEARLVLSGMVYGWDFVYRPPDPRREVVGVFELTSLGAVADGDAGLTVLELAQDGPTHFAAFEFRADQVELRYLEFWRLFAQDSSAGVGRARLRDGFAGRQAALQEALRDAVRARLRFQYQDRPREARGSLALIDPPVVQTDTGDYVYRVEVSIILDEVRPYLTF